MKAEVGKRYRHYKGKEYTVLAIARMEADPTQVCVVYRAEYATEYGEVSVWIRPQEEFESTVEVNGTLVDRFKIVQI